MKVSFGEIVNKKFTTQETFKQEATRDVIRNVFESQIYPKRSLASILEKKFGVDVVITSLDDGNTMLGLQKTRLKSAKKFNRQYIENNFPQMIINNRGHLLDICKVIENYADKCIEHAKKF